MAQPPGQAHTYFLEYGGRSGSGRYSLLCSDDDDVDLAGQEAAPEEAGQR